MAGYICALIISLFAVVAGIFCMLYPFYHKMVCKISTTATVIDIREKWSRHSDGTRDHLVYYPVFQYRANGEMITIEHNISSSSYQVGDQVEMLYNADNPQQYYIPPLIRWKLGIPVWRSIFLLDGDWFYCINCKSMDSATDFVNIELR